jgi:hypothetical protein
MAVAFFVIALLILTKRFFSTGGIVLSNGLAVLFGLSLIFAIWGTVAPASLAPVEKVWLAIGEKIGTVVTFVLVTLTFFVLVTPIALFLRLLRKDLLSLKIDKSAASYWRPVETGGPATRPYLPY